MLEFFLDMAAVAASPQPMPKPGPGVLLIFVALCVTALVILVVLAKRQFYREREMNREMARRVVEEVWTRK